MKSISIALLSLLLFASSAIAQTAEPPHIIVTGEGTIKAAPDQAWVSVGAENRSKVSKEAQQRNADAMTAIMQKVAAFGIPKDAIKTTAIDLQMEFNYTNGRQTPRGYVARNTVEIRVDDLSKLGDVLDAVANSGATMIHGLRFDVRQRQQVEAAALEAAVKNAMAKAAAVATGAQRAIDRVVRIEESGSEPQPRPMYRAMAEQAGIASAGTPVAAGEIEIRAQVRLTVSIK